MTRQEFIDTINTWGDLVSFCADEDLNTLEYVYSQDDMNDYINDQLPEYASEHSWQEVYEVLEQIDLSYDYYYKDGWLSFSPLDDVDFDSYKSDVMEEMDGYWDEESEEAEQEVEDVEIEDQEPLPEEDISIGDLFNLCSGRLNDINNEAITKEAQETEDFEAFVSEITK